MDSVTPNNTVAGLAEKWRKDADRASAESASTSLIPKTVCELRAEAMTFQLCASELEAALASPAPSAGVDEALREAAEEALGLLETLDPLHGITTQLRAALQHPAAPSVEATPNPLARYWMNRAEFWMQISISLGWREVRDAANGEAPSVSPAVEGGFSRAWSAVAATLTEVAPGWDTPDGTCDMDRACDAIRRLATPEQPGSAVQGDGKITFTAAEITDLAEFVGLSVTCPEEIEPDTEIDVYPCPQEGVLNEGEPSDPGTRSHYRYVAVMTDYPEEGCFGLGNEIGATPPPAPAAEQGDDSFVRIENVVRTLPPGYAFADAVEHAVPETITQPEARGVEGMALVPRSQLVELQSEYLVEGGMGHDLVTAMLATAPAAPGAAVGVDILPMDDDVRDILGRPCFTLIGLANALRKAGFDIPPKAEAEQAACLHWMLNLYLKHGAGWRKEGNAALTAALAGKDGAA